MAHLDELARIEQQLVALFPVGSDWYDARNDDGIRVLGVIPGRGVVFEVPARNELTRKTWGQLLNGAAIPVSEVIPEPAGTFFERYHQLEKRIDTASEEFIRTHGNSREMWS